MKILVTGGSRGIGKSIVDKFEKNGHSVDFTSSKKMKFESNTKFELLEYDVLINNAGVNNLSSIENLEDYDEILNTNFICASKLFKSILPYMKSNNFGRVVNLGSIWIDFAKEKRFLYSASKKALHALTEHITVEYSKFNILANTVSPGYVETEMTYKNNSDTELEIIKSKIPMNRLAKSDEIAELVYYLCINNSYITGQNIYIDGGYTCSAH